MTNEFALIARMTRDAPRTATELSCGAGDDCAVIAGPRGRDWLVTTDALIEGIHFRRAWTDLQALGRKALSVNLSDIAAMGGIPRFFLVAIGFPREDAAAAAEGIAAGMHTAAHEHGAILIGGDTVASPAGIALSITAIGEAEHGAALLRSGARPGDAIWVTGAFGGSALGLALLAADRHDAQAEPFIRRHLDPTARIPEGRWIARSGMATAMIDVSDGLLADLGHIADTSGVGFEVDAAVVPHDPGFDALARELRLDPDALALGGGEDYELLFTVAAAHAAEFEKHARSQAGFPAARIGTIVGDASVRRVRGADVSRGGFDHFA